MDSERIIELGIENPTMLGIALALTRTYDTDTGAVFFDLLAKLDAVPSAKPDQPSCS